MKRFLQALLVGCTALIYSSCAQTRIHEHDDWQKIYAARGLNDACIILRDHNHEEVHYYNKDRCIRRFSPASTFKIFNSLVGLETATAPDEQYVIKWDGVQRWNPLWNKDMNMREAFKVSNVAYYQELARRIGRENMQHYLDTVQYGNRRMGGAIDMFWLNDTLQISADEELGFVRRLYFDELPFSERTQRIVRSMMLQESNPDYKLYYKTGTSVGKDSSLFWVVGFIEKIVQVKEDEKSMNKSSERNYPYFFAQNFSVPETKSLDKYFKLRIEVLKDVLRAQGIMK